MRWQKVSLLEVAILAKMASLAKMAEMENNRQIVHKNSNKMAKGPFYKTGDFGKNVVFGTTAK